MTLADLNAAWQNLRTVALGRSGMEEHVSPALASRLTQALTGWQEWYTRAGFAPELTGSMHPEVASWLEQYRKLEYDVRREGLHVPVFAESAGERIPDVSTGLGAVAGVVAVLGAAWLWLRSRKGQR